VPGGEATSVKPPPLWVQPGSRPQGPVGRIPQDEVEGLVGLPEEEVRQVAFGPGGRVQGQGVHLYRMEAVA